MSYKMLRISAACCLAFTVLWLVFMIFSMMETGPVNTFEDAIASALSMGAVFKLTYINAVFVTLTAVFFFASLHQALRQYNAEISPLGQIFTSVYAVINLVVYSTQISVIPYLIALMKSSPQPELYQIIIAQLVQSWPGSAFAVFNQLGYAILAIPSVIYGLLLLRERVTWGGRLLILNGMACIVGFIGTITKIEALATGSVAGGVLFLAALIAIIAETWTANSVKSGRKLAG